MNEWISVEFKKPEISDIVMVYIDKNHLGHNPTNYAFCEYTKYGFELSRVTHWMSLPSPPEGEDK